MAKSHLSDKQFRHDEYHQKAKKQGYASRAVFKLEEIDQKCSLFKQGDRVLDLGCAPGSWLQYAAQKVGPKGTLVGVDRFEIRLQGPNWRLHVDDLYNMTTEDIKGDLDAFDVVLSDMAPDTTGIRHADQAKSEALFEMALDIAFKTLSLDGHFVGKLFQGPDFHRLVTRCRQNFSKVKIVKPKGSRKQSIEQYVCGLGLKERG